MKIFVLILWYTVCALINLLCYQKGMSYMIHYLIGLVAGSIGANISRYFD